MEIIDLLWQIDVRNRFGKYTPCVLTLVTSSLTYADDGSEMADILSTLNTKSIMMVNVVNLGAMEEVLRKQLSISTRSFHQTRNS